MAIGGGLQAATKLLFGGMLIALAFQFVGRSTDKPAPVAVRAARPQSLPAKTAVAPPPTAIAFAAPQADDAGFVLRRVLKLDKPLRHGDYVWDDKDVPPGPIIITVDTAAETLSIFRGGYEIGTAAILYGSNSTPTPLGTFPITQKDADHVSNIYDAPMPYMQRLTNDGVAIHGSEVSWDAATHGCIGVPVAFAKLLFGQTRIGDRVIVTRGKMMPLGDSAG